MKRLIYAALWLLASTQTVLAWDQQDNLYKVKIDSDAKRAHVEAEIWLEGSELSMFNVNVIPALKNGQADLIDRLEVRDLAGQVVAVNNKGEGDFELQGNRRLKLRYDIRLQHEQYQWPAGLEEVSYHTSEGLMMAGYYLFLAPAEKMLGNTLVEFDLPPGWQARTAWQPANPANPTKQFTVATRRELLNNVMFFGTAQVDQFKAAGIEIALVLGKQYWPQRDIMKQLIETQLQSYRAMFGKAPLAQRYLIIVNQGESGDGGAFAGSFSQFLRGELNQKTRPFWGRVMAHELLHFWNGLALVPAEASEEWFKEGVTDYLTISSMAKNGLYDRAHLMRFLENLGRGQSVARQAQGLKTTVQQAASDKHRSWLLVYGGGSIAALALDAELRHASGEKLGLPDLMKALYAEFGQPGKTYTLADVVRVAKQLSGQDFGAQLQRLVASSEPVDLKPVFGRIGLDYEQYLVLLEHNLTPDAAAASLPAKRFAAMFGMPLQ